jgi:AraC-like DNA-binding protein
VVFGQPLYRQNLQPPNDYWMFNIRFQPGALHQWLRIPMHELVHSNIDAESILGSSVSGLADRLANTETIEDLVSIVENYFWRKFQQMRHYEHPGDAIARFVLDNSFYGSLSQLASMACLSASQLERKFIKLVGVTPRLFIRLSRFQQAFMLKNQQPALDWLSVALQSGYHDYQHMVKDFKEFAGTTPNHLLREEAGSPERILQR